MTSENVATLYNLPIKLLCEDSQQIKTEIPIQEVTFSDSVSQACLSSRLGDFVGWVPSEIQILYSPSFTTRKVSRKR